MRSDYVSPEINVFILNNEQAVLIASSQNGLNDFSKDDGWSLLGIEKDS